MRRFAKAAGVAGILGRSLSHPLPLSLMREMLANLGRSLPTKGVGSCDAQSQLLPTDGLIAQRQAWQPKVFGAATAFVFSALAPALLMTLIWNDPRIAPMVFAFTLVIALSHAVLLGLPLFLIFQSRGWMGIGTCVVLGFLIGAVPAGILTFPASALTVYANAWAGGMPTNALNTAAIWVGYMKPLMYLGLLGALGGIVFWAVFTLCVPRLKHGCGGDEVRRGRGVNG